MSGFFKKLDDMLSNFPVLKFIFCLATLGLGLFLFVYAKGFIDTPEVSLTKETFDDPFDCDECEKEPGEPTCCSLPTIITDPNVQIVMTAATPLGANAVTTNVINNLGSCTKNSDGSSCAISNITYEYPEGAATALSFKPEGITYELTFSDTTKKDFNLLKKDPTAFTVFSGFSKDTGSCDKSSSSQWFQLKMSDPVLITGYKMSQKDMLAWTLLGSNDEKSWTTIDDESFTSWDHGAKTVTFNVKKPEKYKFVKFVIVKSNKTTSVSIANFALIGSKQ